MPQQNAKVPLPEKSHDVPSIPAGCGFRAKHPKNTRFGVSRHQKSGDRLS
jgi:hypothetical protein